MFKWRNAHAILNEVRHPPLPTLRVARTLTTKKLVNIMILNLFKTAEHLFSNKNLPSL